MGKIKKGAEYAGHDVKKGAEYAGHDVKKGAEYAGHDVKKGAEYAGHDVKKGAKSVFNKMKKLYSDPNEHGGKERVPPLIKRCWGIGLYWLGYRATHK